MSDWIFRRGGRRELINRLAIDAWFDASVDHLYQSFKRRWSAGSDFFSRFRLLGVRRVLNELLSEAANLGTGGALLMLLLALPSFEAAEKPDWLSTGTYSVLFIDRDGNELGRRGVRQSDAVPLEEIPDHMIKATLATEDRRFFEHFGVDVFGTSRALVENLKANSVVQGGSSLTQQLAKNLFLTSERSFERKIKEAFLAVWLEHRLTKREILKLYLDRAYMGAGAFGVEAAAQVYFGKSVREVTLAEAAMLAGLYKAPTKYAPHTNLANARLRADEVLSNMVQAGFMTEGQVHGARLNPAVPIELPQQYSPDWFLDWAFEEVQRLLRGTGETSVTARLTIDMQIQRLADTTIKSTIDEYGRAKRVKQGALVNLEADGAVRALVGGVDYGDSQFNRASSARRQAGSTFKPYVYLTALLNGLKPSSTMRDVSPFCRPNHYVTNFGGGSSGRTMTLLEALARSTNTIAVKLSHDVGIKNVIEVVKRLGIPVVDKSCTMALGTTDVSPLQHTGAYAVFANGGLSVRPYAILDIVNGKGDIVYDRSRDEPKPTQIFPREKIEQLNIMMRQVVAAGTAKAAELDNTYVAGKTGTTSAFKDAWFIGFSGKYVTGIWFGNDESSPMNDVTGGRLVAPAWKNFMAALHSSVADVPAIPGLELHPNQVIEQQQLAELKKLAPAEGEKSGTLSEKSRAVLKRIGETLRKARNAASGGSADDRKAGLLDQPQDNDNKVTGDDSQG